ncbi:MAG: hypothetical protein IJM09_04345 [Neisseriaceae bacterium]|nr:hypothetical protein [Neisseriaceae bacterium]
MLTAQLAMTNSGYLKLSLHCRSSYSRRLLRINFVNTRNDNFPARKVLSGCLKLLITHCTLPIPLNKIFQQ